MKTIITLSNEKSEVPKKFQDNDNRYPESLVEYFLERYTKEKDKVLDPFAGLGTTLVVAEKRGRIPYGIEYDEQRCAFIQTRIDRPKNIVCGNSLKLREHTFPKFDFSLTSPPYTTRDKSNVLGKGGYAEYLADIQKVYAQLKPLMKQGSRVVIEVSNVKGEHVTPLAWDIAREVGQVFHFKGEIIVHWSTKGTCAGGGSYGYGYDHSYCLVFKN